MSDYTPTTEEVRDRYALMGYMPEAFGGGEIINPYYLAAFDRWLAAHEAELTASVKAQASLWVTPEIDARIRADEQEQAGQRVEASLVRYYRSIGFAAEQASGLDRWIVAAARGEDNGHE